MSITSSGEGLLEPWADPSNPFVVARWIAAGTVTGDASAGFAQSAVTLRAKAPSLRLFEVRGAWASKANSLADQVLLSILNISLADPAVTEAIRWTLSVPATDTSLSQSAGVGSDIVRPGSLPLFRPASGLNPTFTATFTNANGVLMLFYIWGYVWDALAFVQATRLPRGTPGT